MKRGALVLAALAFLSACSDRGSYVTPTAPGQSDDQATPAASVQPQRYIVLLSGAPSLSEERSGVVAAAYGLERRRTYRAALSGFTAEMTEDLAAQVANHPLVELVEPDQRVSITGTQSPVGSWGQDRIDQQNLPLDDSYTFPVTGAGVHFYGIDTGIRSTHNEFSGRMGNGHTEIGSSTEDCNGHGTHTASTAAGAEYGVAQDMIVHPVRVLDCFGLGFTSDVIAGIDWVAANAQSPAVTNISIGGPPSTSMDNAVTNLVNLGVFVSVSAGNDDVSACNQSPAREPDAFTTGSTTISDQRSSFSNFGTCVDIFAPGSDITAAWDTSDGATATISGTSMAAPHAAGVAGLLLENDPNLDPAQITQEILNNGTAGVVGDPGAGSPNLLLYMGFIQVGPPPPPNDPPTADWTFQCDAVGTCIFDGATSTDDGAIDLYEWINPANGQVVMTGSIFQRTVPQPRNISLTLRVTDDGGLTDTHNRNVTVGPNLGDDPPPPPASITVDDVTVTEGTDMVFTVTLDNAAAGAFTVDVTLSDVTATGGAPPLATPEDFDNVVAQLNFAGTAGETEQFTVSTLDDAVVEGTETFSVDIDASDASVTDTDGATGTINDNDAPPPNEPPVSAWTYQCDGAGLCTFDGTSSSDDGTIDLYEWIRPANGQVAFTGSVFQRTIPQTRSISLTLRVTDDGGLTDSLNRTITVGPNEGDP